jgi:peptidoglycan/LPS O-acetylase OafA/YrhL
MITAVSALASTRARGSIVLPETNASYGQFRTKSATRSGWLADFKQPRAVGDCGVNIFGPGSFRLFLATLVVVSHFTRYDLGVAAVYAFFVLSGYWIYVMYARRYSQARSPYATFVISRLWRLLPVFWLMNILTIGMHIVVDGWSSLSPDFGKDSIVPNIAILGYVNWHQSNYLGQAWSLDVELQFYLLAPCLFMALRRWEHWVAAAIVVLGAIGSIWIHDGTMGSAPNYLLLFGAGIIAAHYDWTPSKRVVFGSALVCLLLASMLFALTETRGVVLHGDPIWYQYNGDVSLALALLAIPFSLWTVRLASSRFDRMAGELSYIVYLLHYAGAFLWHRHTDSLSGMEKLPYLAPAMGVVYAGAWLVWRFYDRPIDQKRTAFVDTRLESRSLSHRIAKSASQNPHDRNSAPDPAGDAS